MKTAVLLRHLIADVYSRRLHIFDEPVSFTEYFIIWETDDINIISKQLISILKSKIKKQKV
jgi:hypothetical protein